MAAVRLPGVLAFGVRGTTASIRGWPLWAAFSTDSRTLMGSPCWPWETT